MRKKKQNSKRKPFKGESSKDREKKKEKEFPVCFECKKLGHFKIDYPFLKKSTKKMKKKTMMTKWSDNEDSSFDEDI